MDSSSQRNDYNLTVQDLLDAEDAPAWCPHKEDDHDRDLMGTLVSVGSFVGDYGESKIWTIDRGHDGAKCVPSGRFAKFFAFGTVAAEEVGKANAQVGDAVGVRFRGMGETKAGANAGAPYPLWRVAVKHVAPISAAMAPTEERSPVDVEMDERTKGGGDDEPIPF